MTATAGIGVAGWRNYSTFSLFSAGSQRADKNTSLMVDTASGNFGLLATDWNLGARVPCSLSRAYSHQDDTSGVDRPFGPGWYWQWDMNITGSMDGTATSMWKDMTGAEHDFTSPTGGGNLKTYTSPAGMHQYTLTFDSTRTNEFELTVGKMTFAFKVNSDDSRARLMYVRDEFGNGIEVDRPVDGNSDPEATIDYLQIRYHNGSTWTTANIVQPTYSSGLITKLRLLDTLVSSDYIDLHYTYTTVDSADRLTKVEPKFGSTALNMEVEYAYNSGDGLELQKVYDTEGSKAGTPYYWTINYTSDKVSSIVFPIASGDTGTVAYVYATSEPTSWSHADPNSWNKVTDALSNDWFYGQNTDGSVMFAVDPLWANSSHESYTEYAYNGDKQPTSVKSPKPNDENGQVETKFYYNGNKNLEVTQDAYGFLSFYKYGTRASYSTSGTAATIHDVIGTFTPQPNQKAYADNDHTDSETVAPGSPTITDALWDAVDDYWYYNDGTTPTAQKIKLSRTVMEYTYTTGTGKLTTLLSCSPENFGETDEDGWALTTDSGCSKQEFDTTVGDLEKSYTPRGFQTPATYKWTAYTNSQTYGSVTEVENADSVKASAGKKTKYTYNAVYTKVTKTEFAQDNANQWSENVYNNNEFLLGVKKPDIGSWSVTPQVNINEYDYNGNFEKGYTADPAATAPRWDGDSTHGYDEVRGAAYDRINRATSSYVKVDWDQSGGVETLTTYMSYDDNGNVTRVKGPAYADGGDTKYSYNFSEYDAMNRSTKTYVMVASTNSNLGSVPGGTDFSETLYGIGGEVKKTTQPLYNGGSSTTNYASIFTYDWRSAQIKVSQGWTNYSPSAANRTTEQHMGASRAVYWSQDGEGYKMYPEYDMDGRLFKMHRGTVGGDNDEHTYDADGHLLYYYSFKDVETSSKFFRHRYEYDEMGRMVNSGREEWEPIGSTWENWNENTADTTFNYNGAQLKSYDKVNSGKYTESVYDNWGQRTKVKAPAVPNPAGGGDITYETQSTFNVIGQVSSADDHMNNTTTYTYDLLGRAITVNNAENYDVDTYFDARSNKWKVNTPNGSSNIYTYNDKNQLLKHRLTADSTNYDTTYLYTDNGQVSQVTRPDSGIVKTEYDELGRKDKTRVLLSGSDYLDTTYQYDDNNNPTKTTIPGSYHTDNTYDDLNNLTKSEDTNRDDTDYTYDKDNRRLTTTTPNGLVTTNTYAWKTGGTSSVLYERNATSGDDIEVSYTFDDNGQATTINDGRGNNWLKAYDAMRRNTTLTTPNPGGGAFTNTITYDGNSNITKTNDFKGTDHFYQYDGLNRMTGNGADSDADDQTYTWACCSEMTAYVDSLGTAALVYNDRSQLTSNTDSNGNAVLYEYDTVGRVSKVTPPQGANYRTQYTYKKNGSVLQVKVYDAGSAADTDYTYNTTSGQLTQRNNPVVSSANIRTTYAYDAAGRVASETVTREAGGTTNLYKTAYAYSWLTYGKQVIRTEQTYDGGWDNDNRLTYEWDSLSRQEKENRDDWVPSAWVVRYDVAQEYDKNGNRTRMHRNTAGGYESDYGVNEDLSYTFNEVNQMSAISDADDGNFSCSVTCDANNNITQIEEVQTVGMDTATLTTDFTYDWGNRLTEHKTTQYNKYEVDSWITKRGHTIDAIGRTAKSSYLTYWNKDLPGSPDTLEHTYDRSRHIQNYDGSSYAEVWHWAGAANQHSAPLKSPNADTASQKGYNIANDKTPQRRTFTNPTSEGDQRHLYGQGKPQAKNSSGAGANWYLGTAGESISVGLTVNSRTMFEGTVTATDMDRATDAREKSRIGIFGTGNAYAGSSGRVTSERIGRDLNPLGRGDGRAYVGGEQNYGRIAPRLPMNSSPGGWGNSVNNGCENCNGNNGRDEDFIGPTRPSLEKCCGCLPSGSCQELIIIERPCEGREDCCAPACHGVNGLDCCVPPPSDFCGGNPCPLHDCKACEKTAADFASASGSGVVATAKKMAEGCLKNYFEVLKCWISWMDSTGLTDDHYLDYSWLVLKLYFIWEAIRILQTANVLYDGSCKCAYAAIRFEFRGLPWSEGWVTCGWDKPFKGLFGYSCHEESNGSFNIHTILLCPKLKAVCQWLYGGSSIKYSCCLASTLVHEALHQGTGPHRYGNPFDRTPYNLADNVMACCGCPNESGGWKPKHGAAEDMKDLGLLPL